MAHWLKLTDIEPWHQANQAFISASASQWRIDDTIHNYGYLGEDGESYVRAVGSEQDLLKMRPYVHPNDFVVVRFGRMPSLFYPRTWRRHRQYMETMDTSDESSCYSENRFRDEDSPLLSDISDREVAEHIAFNEVTHAAEFDTNHASGGG